MSTMHVVFGPVMGGGAPVFAGNARSAEAVTTSGTSAASNITAQAGEYATVSAHDAALYVAVSKVATSAVGYYIGIGEKITIGPLKTGDTISGIEV